MQLRGREINLKLTISLFLPAAFVLLLAGCGEGTSTAMPDFELPDTSGSTVSLSKTLAHSHFAVLVFYRGHRWGICRTQLVELQQMYPEFQYLDAELLGISMDNIAETSRLVETLGVTYKLLSDPNGKVVKEYGVYNLLGDGVAAPAVFIIGPNRSNEWSYLGRNIGDRPSVDDIIAHLK